MRMYIYTMLEIIGKLALIDDISLDINSSNIDDLILSKISINKSTSILII